MQPPTSCVVKPGTDAQGRENPNFACAIKFKHPPVHIRLNESAVYYTVFSEVQPFAIEQLFTPSLYGFELSLS